MKYFWLLLVFFLSACANDREPSTATQRPRPELKDSGLAPPQGFNPYASVDISPMDMAYWPADFPLLKMDHKTAGAPVARVVYSRPHRQGRTIFGGLLKYGAPWRMGANEATEIEFFQPVTVQGKRIDKGRYVLYCIPQHDKWTIIFNSNLFSWGLTPDPSKDLYKFDVPVSTAPTTLEYFTMVFDAKQHSASLIMAWENVVAMLPIEY